MILDYGYHILFHQIHSKGVVLAAVRGHLSPTTCLIPATALAMLGCQSDVNT